jgi:protein-serine/threonine kinase
MPYLSHLIPVCLSPERATTYFRQLCSAVGYLHERGITHNDIKPANVMLSFSDVPTLVDFGFANKWQLDGRSAFLSNITWGTPEVCPFEVLELMSSTLIQIELRVILMMRELQMYGHLV